MLKPQNKFNSLKIVYLWVVLYLIIRWKIIKWFNCIFEIDKASLEIKRRIIGNWYSPDLLNIEPNGNLQIIAFDHINNVTRSDMRYLLTIGQNGKIIKKVSKNGIEGIDDAIFVDNKIIC